jgi:DNA-binding transcriptional LysR family regulator
MDLDCFLTVVQRASFTKAAQELFISARSYQAYQRIRRRV